MKSLLSICLWAGLVAWLRFAGAMAVSTSAAAAADAPLAKVHAATGPGRESIAGTPENLVVKNGQKPLAPQGRLPASETRGAGREFALAPREDQASAASTGLRPRVLIWQPGDRYLVPGGNVTLASKAMGLSGVTYQWRLNKVNIPGATNAILTLTNVQPAQQGVYNVLATGEVGSIQSSNVNLLVLSAPVVTSQTPAPNQTVYYQADLTLGVTASAPGQSAGFPLGYQWQFNGTNLPGANAHSYNIAANTGLAGTYSVAVTNAAGGTNLAWHVTVNYGTLGYYLATNLLSYTNGHSGSYEDTLVLSHWNYALYSGANLAHLTNAVWSSRFWLHNVKGLSATAIGYSNGMGAQTLVTMVSPRHYLFATHTHPEGALVAFLDTNNVIHWRTTLQRVDTGYDTSVGLLNSDLPPAVGFLPVGPTNLAEYLPAHSACAVQGVGMNQDACIFSQPMTFDYASMINWSSRRLVPFGLGTNWNVALRGGDSSNPEMFVIKNQLVLLSHNFTPESGPDYSARISAINQAMHQLSTNNGAGTDYRLTSFPLTDWPKIR